MAATLDRTARGTVIFHGISGAFLGAVPAAVLCLMVDKPFANQWVRDLLIYGALGGALIGSLSCMAGMLHEDLRALRRQRLNVTNEPHMDKALMPAPARGGSDFQVPSLREPADVGFVAVGAEARR